MIKLLMICYASFFSGGVFAQDPLHWTFSAKKITGGKYELHLKASVQNPWHTYSQSTPEGGPLPTKILFSKNPLLKIQGIIKEIGVLKTTHDETFRVDVKYFLGDVDFVQVVMLKAKVKTTVTGTVEFMACNDQQCLPPKIIPFSISLQ